ncbi:hypothetical protein KDX27_42160 [Burkholderia cenocepacia]|uniref:hypothetical protein n=1 Tax=Burkholderia cenocepacia TaxID=95486 RepID=UPI001B94F5C5|nr:hypothetical protein [Burkholderia cenocepacia]MBR8030378.1 hypothetical protein [Burkholderia cenocepacia]MBR8174269.1 hypothetical protein [Burkholderia cenocepacia]
MKLRVLVTAVMLWGVVGGAQAQALPVAATGMAQAVGGILSNVAVGRGFAMNDPRIYQTLYSVGKQAASVAAGAEAGLLVAGTAPAWGSILGTAALAIGTGVAISVGTDALVQWAFGSNTSGPITVTAPATSGAPVSGLMVQPGNTMPTMAVIVANSLNSDLIVVTQSPPNYYSSHWYTTTTFKNPNPAVYNGYQTYGSSPLYYVWSGSPTTGTTPCPAGTTLSGSQCVGQATGNTTTANQTLDQASKLLTQAQQQQAINDQTMAMMLNYLWQQAAAQPGYSGLPYQVSQPVQQGDVSSWRTANPGSAPQVGWLDVPIPSGGFAPSTSSTSYNPATSPTTPGTTNPAPASEPVVNLGPDPGNPAPALEQTPTAQMILQPLLSLFPDLRSYAVPSHNAVCPKPSITLFGKSMVVDQQCTLAEQFRSQIYAVFAVAFTIAAMFIVLGA